jgi:hypothetical protein
MTLPHVYKRPEIVNGTGFPRGAKFIDAESAAHWLARFIRVAHIQSDINVSVEGRAVMAEARAFLAAIDANVAENR